MGTCQSRGAVESSVSCWGHFNTEAMFVVAPSQIVITPHMKVIHEHVFPGCVFWL